MRLELLPSFVRSSFTSKVNFGLMLVPVQRRHMTDTKALHGSISNKLLQLNKFIPKVKIL